MGRERWIKTYGKEKEDLSLKYFYVNMKKNKWALVLKEDVGDVIVEKFNSKQIAEEELEYRNSLTVAMGYSPDVKYIIKKL